MGDGRMMDRATAGARPLVYTPVAEQPRGHGVCLSLRLGGEGDSLSPPGAARPRVTYSGFWRRPLLGGRPIVSGCEGVGWMDGWMMDEGAESCCLRRRFFAWSGVKAFGGREARHGAWLLFFLSRGRGGRGCASPPCKAWGG